MHCSGFQVHASALPPISRANREEDAISRLFWPYGGTRNIPTGIFGASPAQKKSPFRHRLTSGTDVAPHFYREVKVLAAEKQTPQKAPTKEDAQKLSRLGLRPIWLSPPTGPDDTAGKNPFINAPGYSARGWQRQGYVPPTAITDPPLADCNMGIITGDVQGAPLAFVVVDCDSEEAIEWAVGNLPHTRMATITGKGLHLYYRHPRNGPIRNGAKIFGMKLDVRADGGQVVVAPSIHKNGHVYREQEPWTDDLVQGIPFFDRAWIARQETEAEQDESAPNLDGKMAEGGRNDYLTRLAGTMRRKDMPHSAILAALIATNKEKCSPPLPDHEVKTIAASISSLQAAEFTDGWHASLNRGKKGDLLSTTHNLEMILKHDPEWAGAIGWDEFNLCTRWMREPPISIGSLTLAGAPFEDLHAIKIETWLQSSKYNLCPAIETINSAVDVVAADNRFHPVRDYLNGVTWDGVERTQKWLIDLMGARDTPYVRNVSRWWLIAAVARVMAPGCKVDNVLILESKQGMRKSTLFRKLVPVEKWAYDSPLVIGSKDTYLALNGAWLVEMAELAEFSRADSAAAKSFFSVAVDRYRPPYGIRTVTVPRQCVFAGTVNHGEYLRDATGNRRYWPVALTKELDVNALTAIRDQLWAEAVTLYRSGMRWWAETAEETASASAEQEERFCYDLWEDEVKKIDIPENGITYSEILAKLGVEVQHQTQASRNRIGQIADRLGLEKIRRRRDGKVTRILVAPGSKLAGPDHFQPSIPLQ